MSKSKGATRGFAASCLLSLTALTIEDVQRLKDLFEKTHLKLVDYFGLCWLSRWVTSHRMARDSIL